jgi:hypothetical protein
VSWILVVVVVSNVAFLLADEGESWKAQWEESRETLKNFNVPTKLLELQAMFFR